MASVVSSRDSLAVGTFRAAQIAHSTRQEGVVDIAFPVVAAAGNMVVLVDIAFPAVVEAGNRAGLVVDRAAHNIRPIAQDLPGSRLAVMLEQ